MGPYHNFQVVYVCCPQIPPCFKTLEDKTNPWVYYYATAYRTPEDVEIYQQFVDQDQASTVVKSRKEDRHSDFFVVRKKSIGSEEEELEKHVRGGAFKYFFIFTLTWGR